MESSDQNDGFNKEEDTEESKEDDSLERGTLGVQNLDELSTEERYSRFWDNELSFVQLTARLENMPRYFAIFDINIKELEKSSENEDKEIRELIEQWRRREEEVAEKVDDLVKRYIQALITRFSHFVQVLIRRHRLRAERTHLEEKINIDHAEESSTDLDDFKEEENNGTEGSGDESNSSELDQSSEGSGEESNSSGLDQSSEASGDESNTSEFDQSSESQEQGSRSEQGYEESEEVKDKEDFMQLIDLTSKVTFYQSEESNPAFVSNIKEFGGKIYELIHERKADFKKVQHDSKKMSLMKWLKGSVKSKEHLELIWLNGSVKSNEHLELIKAVKGQVVRLLTKVSSLLATLMFLMLGNEEMKAKFSVLELSINWVTEDGDSVVTRTIISLLKMIVEEVERKSEAGKSIVADRAPIDLTIFTEFYQLVRLFLDGIKFLEQIIMLEAEPDSDSNESVKNLLCSVNEYEEEYSKKVEAEIEGIYKLKELYSGEPEEVTIHYGLEIKIDELWNQVWNSEEDEGSDVAELNS